MLTAVAATLRFPEGFLWGSATSSHQVEGNNRNNDWWAWEKRSGAIRDGEISGAAAGWWEGRAEEDLSTAAELGQNAHRLSLEWSRLEPEPGIWDEAAFDRYARMFAHAKSQNLTLMVTLNHFTLPRWAAGSRGWLDEDLPRRLGAFATRCVERLGDYVDLWATINEPNILAFFAYGQTRWPPGCGRFSAFRRALIGLLQAHVEAYRAIHRAKPGSKVGLVLNVPCFEPARPVWWDRGLSVAHDWTIAGSILNALRTGKLPAPFSLRRRRVTGLDATYEWIGINYYGRYAVQFDPRAATTAFSRYVQQPTTATPWSDWGQPYAPGLTHQLMRLRDLDVPVYVTENGLFDNDDRARPAFIHEHVQAVHAAIERGVDVRGYFHWSLVDNFEWAEGWSTRFGLLELERQTGARRLRSSAGTYASICRANAVPAGAYSRSDP